MKFSHSEINIGKLDATNRALIIRLLVEGNGIRATSRIMYCYFVKLHQSLKVTLVMESGLTDRL